MAGAALPRYPLSLQAFADRIGWLIELLRAELAPHQRRVRNAIRMATVGAAGAGVMAACHVHSTLGAYIVWTLVGSGAAMMGFGPALGYTIAAGVLMALSVPIAGMLSETPWLMLPFVGAAIALMSYVVTTRRFGSAGLVLKVVVLDTFYNVVFHPHDFASMTASTFGGTALAFGTVALFDTWIWPNPAEARLLGLVSEGLMRTSGRLRAVTDAYLDPRGNRMPPPAPPVSAMPLHLELLDQAETEGVSEFRRAVLLATISRAERLHGELDRMTTIAQERVPRDVRAMLQRELADAAGAIADAIEEFAREIPREIPIGPDLPPPPAAARVMPAMKALDEAILAARPSYITRTGAEELINFGAFGASLARMADLTGRRIDHPPRAEQQPGPHSWFHRPPFDSSLARYGIKVGIATVLGYVVGVTSHHEELGVILTTILIAGLPTYGASLHKMILRLAGNTVGGVLAILATIIVTPNFETLPVYMMACAAVFVISGYAGLSSGRIAYAGKQIGTAFILAFAGLGPTDAIDGPLYRVWGIILGVLVVMAVFFTIWPEYASDSMLPRLSRMFRDTLDLIPVTTVSSSPARIDAINSEISRTLFELLGVADDAKLEGARSAIDPGAVVDACGTLRRIAHRFARLDAERLAHPLDPLTEGSAALHAQFVAAMRARVAGWAELIARPGAFDAHGAAALAAAHSSDELARPLQELDRRISADQFAEISGWTLEQRRTLLAELQSFHRLSELVAELDGHLARIPRR